MVVMAADMPSDVRGEREAKVAAPRRRREEADQREMRVHRKMPHHIYIYIYRRKGRKGWIASMLYTHTHQHHVAVVGNRRRIAQERNRRERARAEEDTATN